MYIPLKSLFSRHKGIGVQFTDEPTGNLDQKNSREIMGLFRKLNEVYGQTILLITHDRQIAKNSRRIIVIEDGKIVKEMRRQR